MSRGLHGEFSSYAYSRPVRYYSANGRIDKPNKLEKDNQTE